MPAGRIPCRSDTALPPTAGQTLNAGVCADPGQQLHAHPYPDIPMQHCRGAHQPYPSPALLKVPRLRPGHT
jgi:hypothetical protein